jgi:hypothetical protein
MNRNILKWILIAAVVLGAAAYLILSETPSKKEPKKEKIVVGHSKAFKIEPVEGITISAPENALDKDREFKLSPVDDKTYDKVTKAYENTYIKPLFVFEFDAGLKPDEHLPGDVDVVWDLDEMGIPRELQDQFVVYRAAGTGKSLEYLRYKTHLDNGKLSFKTNQNSFLLGAILVAAKITAVVQIGRRIFEYSPSFGQKSSIRNFFSSNATSLAVPIQDPSGDFVIHFRFSDTERSNGYQAFMDNEKAVFDRLEELEKQATAKYEAKVDKEVRDQQKGYSFWQKLFSKKQVEAIKESISKEKILDELVKIDSVLTRLNTEPAGNLPPSILKIKEQIIRANEYLNGIGLHPFNYEIPVYLVNDDVVGSDVCGAAQKYYFCGNAYLLLNYKHEKTDQLWEKFQCTIVHELFHARQQSYYALTTMNSAPAESTAAALEDDAAILWFKNKVFKTDATTVKGANDICTDRDHNYVFAYPLEKAMSLVPSGDAVDAAYSLSYAIEGIRKNADKEYMSMYFFALNYSLFGPHTSGWKGWIKTSLNIDDQQFDDGWFYFGETNLNRIYKSQIAQTTPNDAATTIIELSKDHPISKLEKLEKPKDYSVNTFRIDLKSERIPGVFGLKTVPANVFVSPSNRKGQLKWNPFLRFYLYPNEFTGTVDESDHLVPLKPNLYCTTEGSFPLAAIATTQSQGENNDYFIVALYAPDAPDITKVKDDHISFILTKPSRDLTKNKLVTGAVVTYTDKNGNTQTLDVNPKQFGKRVKWPVANASKKGNAFTLTAHWYYKPDEQTTYVSPESNKAEWGGHLDEQEEPQAEEKAPETNYWKLVNVRMEKTNTSYKESQNPDEEVDADYRSIDFAVDRTEKSCTFMGFAATEEVHEDNTRHYVRDLYLDGTLTFTEPPKFWTPGRQYKAICEVADDPYLLKISEPFVFEAENSSSQPTVCLQSKNDKIDKGWSSLGETNWLRGTSTTFEAHSPEKDGPKSFTLIQSYSIAERPGSSLMAKVVFYYDYEWIGEPEEEVKEEETAPEGGYWQLVKTEVDDSKAKEQGGNWPKTQLNPTGKSKTNGYVTGSNGQYTAFTEWWDYADWVQGRGQTSYRVVNTTTRDIKITVPKKRYLPGEQIVIDVNHSPLSKEGDGELIGNILPHGFAYGYRYIGDTKFPILNYFGFDINNPQEYTGQVTRQYTSPYLPKEITNDDWKSFVIIEEVKANYGKLITKYYYEWVDGEQKEEDLGNLVIGIEFPMNARDKAYFGEHGGSLLHRNDFGVKIPSGSYSVKKSGKGYILEGSGHSESSSPSPRASHNIEVRIVLDKNKIPVEASFSCQGFYEGTGRTMKTETTTFQATGTAKLTEKELGPNSRRGKCTSFNGIIHTESEGDFDYSNTEGGHLTIRWKCD